MSMPGKTGFQKVSSCVCLLLVLCVSSNCGTLELAKPSNANPVKRDTNVSAKKSHDTLYYLDISRLSISQPIEPASDKAEGAKFVQVEVVEVLNPKKYALSFEVHYQPHSQSKSDEKKILLGTFGLYPADNPGEFIVATQGKVKNEGSIVLSLVIAGKVGTGDQVKVGVKRIKFLQR